MRRQLALVAAVSVAGTVCGTAIEQDANAEIFLKEGRTIFRYTQSGTLKVTESGTVDVLVVGGGGGGGQNASSTSDSGGAGGGGGGVVYRTSFDVVASSEPYQVVVGSGGAVGQNGGNSSVFGITAYGGGAGARYATNGSTYAGKNGGSGGGSTRGGGLSTDATPGEAIYGEQGNIGNAGGIATHHYAAAGGGGAGGGGGNSSGTTPGTGGSGYDCPILYVPFFATNTCYGGGGAGFRYGKTVAGGTGGGGSMKNNVGEAGADGLGGGGCGGYAGGSGVVIISFTRTSEPRDRGWFGGTGGDESLTVRGAQGREEVRIFRQNGTLTLEGAGTIDVLAVGGGGGGGILVESTGGCGGGGAGGVVYCTNLSVKAGTYSITVGEGGGAGTNGYATIGLGITAFGGGAGAASGKNTAGPGVDGASGGGASWPTSSGSGGSVTNSGGSAIYADCMNKGHAGGGSNHVYGGGGGGGAGEAGHGNNSSTSGNGGDGYPCSITGTSVYYGGGGSGYRGSTTSKSSGGGLGGGGNYGHAGTDGFGGGGSGSQPGGKGVFIVRYRLKPNGMVISFR